MTIRAITCAAAFAALLAAPALADGGPIPEPIPEPEPVPEPESEPAPVYEPEPAPAPAGGYYASLAGGAAWLSDIDFDVQVPAIVSRITVESDTGWAALGALGYAFGNGARAELEVGYRSNDGIAAADFEGGIVAGDSTVAALDIMANLLYDFETGMALQPYVGVGVGAARADIEFNDLDVELAADGWAFAYQFIGGLSFPLPNAGAAVFADYRYLATAGLETEVDPVYVNSDEYRSHTVVGGIRVSF